MPFQHATVRFAGELDAFTRQSMQQRLAEVDADIVVVDLTEVTFMDAGALGCLVGFKQRLRTRDRLGIVRIVTPDCRFQRLFRITGLDKVFDMYDSVEELAAAG